jgi:hypothetical protein
LVGINYIVHMKQFISSNIAWVYQYFDKNKKLLETFSFLMVAQTFIYSSDLKDVSAQSIAAFRIVLWIRMFLLIILLQISTAVDLYKENGVVRSRIFAGANFMKTVMRLLMLVLLLASVPIFIKQVQDSLHNRLFSVVYVSLGVTILFEVAAYVTAKALPKSVAKH